MLATRATTNRQQQQTDKSREICTGLTFYWPSRHLHSEVPHPPRCPHPSQATHSRRSMRPIRQRIRCQQRTILQVHTSIYMCWGYLMPKQKRTWYSNWNKKRKQKRKTKIQFKNRLNETSLLPKSFVCQSGDWKWDWKCLPAGLPACLECSRQSKLTNMRTVCDVFEGSSQLRSYFHRNCGNTRGLTYA